MAAEEIEKRLLPNCLEQCPNARPRAGLWIWTMVLQH